ncbi:MAG: FAD-dependent oxidoreductase [Clostridioides sp.]|jgi:NAD(P)H-nitrite reductase large subunit|nr:FAD-dependent oxidoreductase [Clostridioides sp.]
MNYVILGASASGINAAKTLRELDQEAKITVISKDTQVYSRCMLHLVISDKREAGKIGFVDDDFMEANRVDWLSGKTVTGIDTDNKIVEYNDGKISYDKLLIATGASSAIPPIKNLREGKYVYSLRNIEDVHAIKERAAQVDKCVIIGAGLVGIDALEGLFKYNLDMSVAFMEKYLLDRQLDEHSAKLYTSKFEEKGVKFYPSASIQEIILDENGNATGVGFADGSVIDTEMVIVATGVKANADFLGENSDIAYDRGIIINDRCETSVKDVYAAGDVVGKNAIWPLAVKQGIVAATNMTGEAKDINDSFVLKNTMNFEGIPTVSLGMNNPVDDSYTVVTRKRGDYYKKFIYKDDVIYGAIMQGDISYVGVITYLIKNGISVPNLKDRIFDLGYADFFATKENGEYAYIV